MSLVEWLGDRLWPAPGLTEAPPPDELFVCHYQNVGNEERAIIEQPPRYQHVYVTDKAISHEYLVPFPWTYYQLWSVGSWSRKKKAEYLVDVECVRVRPWRLDKDAGPSGLALYRPPLPNTWPESGNSCTPSRIVPPGSPEFTVRTALSWFWEDEFNTDLQPWAHPLWKKWAGRGIGRENIHNVFSRWATVDLAHAHRLPWAKGKEDLRLFDVEFDEIVRVPLAKFSPK